MIDLHNHILPGLDDGAANLDEALEIARTFVLEGVTAVAATPHYDALNGRGTPAPTVRERVEQFQRSLEEAEIPLEVFPGNELQLAFEAPDLVALGNVSTLGGSHYVLVEVPLNAQQMPPYGEDAMFRLQVAGFKPILAHPDRYPFVNDDPTALDELVHRDVLLQLTAPSLLGVYGRGIQRTAEALLHRGAYALGASDRHHPGSDRSLSTMAKRIAELVSEDLADLLLTRNPRNVLDDSPVIRPELSAYQRPGLWSRLIT